MAEKPTPKSPGSPAFRLRLEPKISCLVERRGKHPAPDD
jgi:hypothetical protein